MELSSKFDKVLIANRGAIACRVIRTLRAMGMTSVVVYAEADADSLHVRQADEAWSLGEGASAATYLDQDKLFEVIRKSGAGAIHPGYGFLSENADFARRCEAEGVVFLGPTPKQMEQFGLKHTARSLAENAGVPLLPGTGLIREPETGVALPVEIWRMPADHFGSFVAGIPAPLGIGKVELADSRWVCGFICEPIGLEGAEDITAYGGWRGYSSQ